MKTLILFASKYGATEKCAREIAQGINSSVDLVNLKMQNCDSLEPYHTVLIGGSVYAGRIQGEIKKYLESHQDALKGKNIGLFLCCKDEGAKAIEYLQANLPEWVVKQAFMKEHLGHEIDFNKMNFMERSLLKLVFKVKEGYSKIDAAAIQRIAKKVNELDVVNG